jgi:hypothetical protein
MKYLVLACTLLSCAVATAMPKIGDYSSMAVTLNNVAAGTIEFELISFDPATSKFTQRITENVMGNRTVSSSATDGVSDALINQIIADCALKGGAIQNISVPAGAFHTCALPINSNGNVGTMWVAAVPFGVVKADVMSSGTHIVEDLASFKMGQ